MYRQPLTDSDGNPTARWFDRDAAVRYQAGAQELYEVGQGRGRGSRRWILHTEPGLWQQIAEEEAMAWLLRHGYQGSIPRPQPAGRIPARVVRVPDDIWSAAMRTGNASELVRRVLERWYRGECGQ